MTTGWDARRRLYASGLWRPLNGPAARDRGQAYRGGPLWLLLHGEVEYFSANSMYAASQAGVEAISPYVEALGEDGQWKRVVDDMGFPAGGPRTMTADLTGKLPAGTK